MKIKSKKLLPYTIAVAPMVRVSTPQMRTLWNIIAPNIYFYTEMYHCLAVIFNKQLLERIPNKQNGTNAFQIAGNNAENIYKATKILSNNGWQEINLNAGCPAVSARKGEYGLSLLNNKQKLSECLYAMKEASVTKVSLKCRIGVDNTFGEDFLHEIIELAIKAGIDWTIVHARSGWLKGLNPKENRRVPPVDYDCVKKVSNHYPEYPIIINGSIDSLAKIKDQLNYFPAVMIGRWIQNQPFILNDLQNNYCSNKNQTINKYMCLLMDKIDEELNNGASWRIWLNSLMSFLHGMSNCRKWRQRIHECVVSDSQTNFKELRNQWYDYWQNKE